LVDFELVKNADTTNQVGWGASRENHWHPEAMIVQRGVEHGQSPRDYCPVCNSVFPRNAVGVGDAQPVFPLFAQVSDVGPRIEQSANIPSAVGLLAG
jgi:hypothetical protein